MPITADNMRLPAAQLICDQFVMRVTGRKMLAIVLSPRFPHHPLLYYHIESLLNFHWRLRFSFVLTQCSCMVFEGIFRKHLDKYSLFQHAVE